MKELSLAVVGIDFPNPDKSRSNRRFELALCVPGDQVELRPEPRNRHDPNAVAVFSERGVQLGYLSAERAPWIGRKLGEEEAIAVFQQLLADVALVRVRFGGGAPSLPPEREAAPRGDDDGFHADPDGPEFGA